jgi:hypothetical protein
MEAADGAVTNSQAILYWKWEVGLAFLIWKTARYQVVLRIIHCAGTET